MTRSFTTRHPHLARAAATALLVAAALLVAIWVAPRASGDVAAWVSHDPVRLQTLRSPDGGRLRVDGPSGRGAGAPHTLDTGGEFSMAALVCDVPAAGSVDIMFRTSLDGASWGPWFSAPLEIVDERGAPRAFTDPVWTGPANFLQVKAGGGTGAPVALTGVRIVAIDPDDDVDLAGRLARAVRRVAATVAAVGSTAPASAAAAQPGIVTRSDWGADERLRSGSPSYSPVKMAFVHHTASGNTYTPADAPGIVRAIYAYHTRTLGWSDIGYNFVVDRFGTIYEGRYGGITRGVVGAQVYGFNTGSTGVSVIGTFTDTAPPTAALAALERLLAWKLGVAGVDPSGTARLTCGATEKYAKGATVTFPAIAGHRQANYTECPGEAFYARLPAVRSAVAARMGSPSGAALATTTGVISPNGDGLLDAADLSLTVTPAAPWALDVRDEAGRPVASWSGTDEAATVTWDGTSGGSIVPDGVYTVALTLQGGEVPGDTLQVAVDTTAPRLADSALAAPWFSPNGDRQHETAILTYVPEEACAVRVGILDGDGEVLRWLHGWRAKAAQAYSTSWDGRVDSGGDLVAAPDGEYRFAIERRDTAGNVARRGVKVTIDRTVGFPSATPVTISPNGDGRRDVSTVRFTLTRAATVTAKVRVGENVVRTVELGSLAAGAHAFEWDGRDRTGGALTSGRPEATIVAASGLGESSVARSFVVDLSRPRIFATTGRSTRVRRAVKAGVKIVDSFSKKVDLRYTVVDARGRRVTSAHPGWVLAGRTLTVRWTPKKRGVYSIVYRATDLGGNPELKVARTKVTVR